MNDGGINQPVGPHKWGHKWGHKWSHKQQMRGEASASFGLLLSTHTKSIVGQGLLHPTFSALAQNVGIDEETLRRWRFGRTIPATQHLLDALCDALELSDAHRKRLEKQWEIENSRRRGCDTSIGKPGRADSLYPAFAEEADLQEVVALGKNLLGDEIAVGLDPLKRQWRINPAIVTTLRNGSRKLVAYYALLPLREPGFDQVMLGRIIDGAGILEEHIDSSFLTATAIYIGMIGGGVGHAKGHITHELLAQIAPLLHHGHLRAIFARGATADGNRLMQKYGFTPLPPPSEISYCPVTPDRLQNAQIERRLVYT